MSRSFKELMESLNDSRKERIEIKTMEKRREIEEQKKLIDFLLYALKNYK